MRAFVCVCVRVRVRRSARAVCMRACMRPGACASVGMCVYVYH